MSERWMCLALQQAELAAASGEVPVGAVVVRGERIVGCGYNRRERQCDPAGHAEILALREAAKTLGDWRLTGCDIYVTLEPCMMCTGAIRNSRIDRVFFGASDEREGACGSRWDLLEQDCATIAFAGILERECSELLRIFFAKKRL